MKKFLLNVVILGFVFSIAINSAQADVAANTLPVYKNGTNVDVTNNNANMNIKIQGGANGVGTANWNSFNIGKNAGVNVQFTAKNQTSLNYVDASGGMSQIYGNFTNSGYASTGKVILVNPNGILFGNGANVNLNSFTATTMDGNFDKNSNSLDLTTNSSNRSIIVQNGAKIYGDKNVTFAADNISQYKGSQISTNTSTGNVKLVTADGVNFTYNANGSVKDADYNVSSQAMKINVNGNINASNIEIVNKSYNSQSSLTLNGANLKATGAVKSNSGNIYLVSNNDLSAANSTLNANNNIDMQSDKNLDANSNTINAGQNIAFYSQRQLTANNNIITAKAGKIDVTSHLDEMNVTNNTLTAKNDVNITSDTNTLNATKNTIKATNGSVNLTADKRGSIDRLFALNAKNNNITAGKDVNLSSGKAETFNSANNKINATGNVNYDGQNVSMTIKNDKVTAKKDVNINSSKNLTLTSNNLSGKNVTVYAYRQIEADKNTINATNGNVNITSLLDEMNVTNNTLTAKNDVNITSETNTLNATKNTIKATNGSVNLTADKASWGNDVFGLNFTLNAKNNTITSGKNVNLTSSIKVDAQSNKINAGNDIHVEATNGSVKSTSNTYTAKGIVRLENEASYIEYKNANIKSSTGISNNVEQKNDTIKSGKQIAGRGANIVFKQIAPVTLSGDIVAPQDPPTQPTTVDRSSGDIVAPQDPPTQPTTVDRSSGDIVAPQN